MFCWFNFGLFIAAELTMSMYVITVTWNCYKHLHSLRNLCLMLTQFSGSFCLTHWQTLKDLVYSDQACYTHWPHHTFYSHWTVSQSSSTMSEGLWNMLIHEKESSSVLAVVCACVPAISLPLLSLADLLLPSNSKRHQQ